MHTHRYALAATELHSVSSFHFLHLFYLFQSLEIDIGVCMNKYVMLLDPRMQSWPCI